MSENNHPGEELLNRAIELGITNQVQEVENVEASVQTDALKLLGGKVDALSLTGDGIVLSDDLRCERLEVASDGLGIDPLRALFGQLRLTEAVNTTVRLVLTESDLNALLASPSVRGNLQKLLINLDGKPTLVAVEALKLRLDPQLALEALIRLEGGESERLTLALQSPAGQSGLTQMDLGLGSETAVQLSRIGFEAGRLTCEAQVQYEPYAHRETHTGATDAKLVGFVPTVEIISGSPALSRIKLAYMTRARAWVDYPEQAINRVLQSRYVLGNLHRWILGWNGSQWSTTCRNLQLSLVPGQVCLKATFDLDDQANALQLALEASSRAGDLFVEKVVAHLFGARVHLSRLARDADRLVLEVTLDKPAR